eukprot:7075345-Heterocapsa_arctica.AAC.1
MECRGVLVAPLAVRGPVSVGPVGNGGHARLVTVDARHEPPPAGDEVADDHQGHDHRRDVEEDAAVSEFIWSWIFA